MLPAGAILAATINATGAVPTSGSPSTATFWGPGIVLPSTSYTVYCVATDTQTPAGNTQLTPVATPAFTTLADITPPVWIAAPQIIASLVDDFSFALSAETDEPTTLFMVASPAASAMPVPSPADVVAGRDGVGATAPVAVSTTGGAATAFAEWLVSDGVLANTLYDVFLVARDHQTSLNIQGTVTRLNVTTLPDHTPPVALQGFPATAVEDYAVPLLAAFDEPVVWFAALVRTQFESDPIPELSPATVIAMATAAQAADAASASGDLSALPAWPALPDGVTAVAAAVSAIVTPAQAPASSPTSLRLSSSALRSLTSYVAYVVANDTITPVPNTQLAVWSQRTSTLCSYRPTLVGKNGVEAATADAGDSVVGGAQQSGGSASGDGILRARPSIGVTLRVSSRSPTCRYAVLDSVYATSMQWSVIATDRAAGASSSLEIVPLDLASDSSVASTSSLQATALRIPGGVLRAGHLYTFQAEACNAAMSDEDVVAMPGPQTLRCHVVHVQVEGTGDQLVAAIADGDRLDVWSALPLQLDASGSLDLEHSNPLSLSYSWTCSRVKAVRKACVVVYRQIKQQSL